MSFYNTRRIFGLEEKRGEEIPLTWRPPGERSVTTLGGREKEGRIEFIFHVSLFLGESPSVERGDEMMQCACVPPPLRIECVRGANSLGTDFFSSSFVLFFRVWRRERDCHFHFPSFSFCLFPPPPILALFFPPASFPPLSGERMAEEPRGRGGIGGHSIFCHFFVGGDVAAISQTGFRDCT